MFSSKQKEIPSLIEYFVICGVRQSDLVDYTDELTDLKESDFTATALRRKGLIPQIISMHPEEKPNFPLSPNFVDVIHYLNIVLLSFTLPNT